LTRGLQWSEWMVTEKRAVELLAPFGVRLCSEQIGQLLAYLELLLKWNSKMNLTAVRSGEECVTRHFGESLFLATKRELSGWLLDIGSGAGFPGLALKIAFPKLAAVLLEPVGKKRAFLKEVVRTCGMESVEIRPERLVEFVGQCVEGGGHRVLDAATSRAVGKFEDLIPQAGRCLKPHGNLYLWLSHEQGKAVVGTCPGTFEWVEAMPIPGVEGHEIWCGSRRV